MPLDQDADVPLGAAAAVLLVLALLSHHLGLPDAVLTAGVVAVVTVVAVGLRLRMAVLLAAIGWALVTGAVDGRQEELVVTGWPDLARALGLLCGAVLAQRLGHHSRGTCRSPRRAASTSATWRPVVTSRRPSRS